MEADAWRVGGFVLLAIAAAILLGLVGGWPAALGVVVVGAFICFGNAHRNSSKANSRFEELI